jgi:hypothetical protein
VVGRSEVGKLFQGCPGSVWALESGSRRAFSRQHNRVAHEESRRPGANDWASQPREDDDNVLAMAEVVLNGGRRRGVRQTSISAIPPEVLPTRGAQISRRDAEAGLDEQVRIERQRDCGVRPRPGARRMWPGSCSGQRFGFRR